MYTYIIYLFYIRKITLVSGSEKRTCPFILYYHLLFCHAGWISPCLNWAVWKFDIQSSRYTWAPSGVNGEAQWPPDGIWSQHTYFRVELLVRTWQSTARFRLYTELSVTAVRQSETWSLWSHPHYWVTTGDISRLLSAQTVGPLLTYTCPYTHTHTQTQQNIAGQFIYSSSGAGIREITKKSVKPSRVEKRGV